MGYRNKKIKVCDWCGKEIKSDYCIKQDGYEKNHYCLDSDDCRNNDGYSFAEYLSTKVK